MKTAKQHAVEHLAINAQAATIEEVKANLGMQAREALAGRVLPAGGGREIHLQILRWECDLDVAIRFVWAEAMYARMELPDEHFSSKKDAEHLADALYRRGWEDGHGEKDYDPRASEEWSAAVAMMENKT